MSDIRLSVEYYNEVERKLFQNFPNKVELNQIVKNGLVISKDEFLAYMMFTFQMDRNGFRTYKELSALISENLGIVDRLLTFNNKSVQALIIGNDLMQTGFTERIGVSLGLCLVNKIHNLTAADWKKIPTIPGRHGHPTFDFEIDNIASTGSSFIQVENKGCAITDNSAQPSGVKSHYQSIKHKKNHIRTEEKRNAIPLHQNLYYGTISVLDNSPNSIAKVWLIDPPAFFNQIDAKKYKLLARLYFYLDEFNNIGVQKSIINALKKRIQEITDAEDFMSYNLKSLTKVNRQFVKGDMSATVDTDEAFGRIWFVERKNSTEIFLVAYTKAIIKLIVKQDFEAILNYNYDPDFINERLSVLMRFSKNTNIPDKIASREIVFNEKTKLFDTIYFSKVKHSTDGRIFGILKDQ